MAPAQNRVDRRRVGVVVLRLAILTSGRQDWGILRPIVVQLARETGIGVVLLWGGTHVVDDRRPDLDPETDVDVDRLDWIGEDGVSLDPVVHASRALASVGDALARHQPDALMLVGDRFETAAAALAATIMRVPIVHVHGGEETLGAIDNALRHAITKLSHLHLVSDASHRGRVIRLAEDPATVRVVGAPGLDNALRDDLPGRSELQALLGMALEPPLVMVTVHPTTLSDEPTREAHVVSAVMDLVPATYIITLPNLDPDNAPIREIMLKSRGRPNRIVVSALGERDYWGLMKIASAMLGNSSSGLIEAPAIPLPVVNVGARQAGRPRTPGIIDVRADTALVTGALRKALSPEFRAALRTVPVEPSATLVAGALAGWVPPHPPLKAAIPDSVEP